jgi:dUTP pyrophosphatase
MDSRLEFLYRSRFSFTRVMRTEDRLRTLDHAEIAADDRERNAIIIELLHEDAKPPRRATDGSAGYDLCAYLKGRVVDCSDGIRQWQMKAEERPRGFAVLLPANAMALIPLGFKAALPNGYEAQIRPRSGAAFKKGLGIPNAPGTVDSDFPDEWRVIVRNTTAEALEIAHGDRIAQMVLQRYEVLPFTRGSVEVSTERQGGFGSTGQ